MTLKHENLDTCPSCMGKLSQACEELRAWFLWLKTEYKNAHISWSFRDQASQNLAFMKGASKLQWPFSKHNSLDEYGKPASKALDVFQLIDGKAVFNIEWYKEVNEKNTRQNLPVRWGGTFKSLKDFDHFELKEGGEDDGRSKAA